MNSDSIKVFSTCLGWMAFAATGHSIQCLTFGHPTADAARKKALKFVENRKIHLAAVWSEPLDSLIEHLRDYAAGVPVDFRSVHLESERITDFQRRVLLECLAIPYGRTITYGELAAKTGHHRAARAVGCCMAANPIPLIIPCHRVVCSGGEIGRYSAPGGEKIKRKLLAMEAGRRAASFFAGEPKNRANAPKVT